MIYIIYTRCQISC